MASLEERLAALEARDAELEASHATRELADHVSWLLLNAVTVFLMQYGFALLETGMCRKNNATATYTKNIIDASLGALVALLFGYELAYGFSPQACCAKDAYDSDTTIICAKFFHHLVFQATAATIVSGAMAERTTVHAYAILSAFVSAVPFSLVVRWTWGGGWLHNLGFHDFAGAMIVHGVGGAAAVAGVIVVGPRDGRHDPRRFYEFMPHDVASVMGGSLMLWVGWYGFNMGSADQLTTQGGARAAANSAVSTTIAGASGGMTALLLAAARSFALTGGRASVDAISLANGLLSGLVAVTAGSDVFSPHAALAVGVGSAFAYMLASAVSEALYLDDVVEAGAVHAGCGTWGTLAVGLFHPTQGLLHGAGWRQLFIQLGGAIAVLGMSFVSMVVVTMCCKKAAILRVTAEEEARGLDHKFGIAASAHHYDKAMRLRTCAGVLESNGHSISELIEALQSIKHHIILPFAPQASDLMLEGQVNDILARLEAPASSPPPRGGPRQLLPADGPCERRRGGWQCGGQ